MKHITQEEIARKAKISRAAVSLTLSQKASSYRIAQRTQKKILKITQELGYSKNVFASYLRTKKSNLIGIIGASYQMPIRQTRQNFIAQFFKDQGFRVFIQDFHWTEERIKLIKEIEELRPEGLIVAEPEPETVIDYLKIVKDKGVPVVLVDGPKVQGFDQVRIDRDKVVYLGVKHLFEQGYKEVYLTMPKDFSYWAMAERFQGFVRACIEMKKNGSPEEYLLWNNDMEYENSFCLGYQIGQQLWHQSTDFPFGIMALNDQVAIGIMKFLLEKGIKIPEDVGLVGSEDLPESSFMCVPLTSVSFPIKDMAERVGDILLKRMSGQINETQIINLEPELVVRKSSVRKEVIDNEKKKELDG